METFILANIKKLYEDELYDCAIPLCSILSTIVKNDRTLSTPELEYQILLFYGNSLYYQENYRAATTHLEAVLQLRKTLLRAINPNIAAIESFSKEFTEIEIRFRLATCYRHLGEHSLATAILQAITPKERPPKVNMLLAKLFHYGRSVSLSEAIRFYKDVLRDCPLALSAIDALLSLNVNGIEVNSLVFNAIQKNIEWLKDWIKGHSEMYSRKQLEASKTFQSIHENTKLHQNEHILTLIGRCLYYHGIFTQAQPYLESAIMINPTNMDAMMPLAVVYEYNQKHQELEKMASQLMDMNEFESGHWFVIAQNYYATGRYDKAASFTQKAIAMNERNAEAQILRGKICLQLKRHKEAIVFFRAAQVFASYRFEVYKGLFHCYIGLKRGKEAQTMCALAVRYFRNSPRSYLMFARTLFHSPNPAAKRSAKKFVAKAIEIDENYAPAVALMAEVHQSEGETQEAIALLKKQVLNYPHHKLFTMLGDILSAEKDFSGALEYYTIALSMDPTYARALEGVNALGQSSCNSNKTEPDAAMPGLSTAQDEEWPIECDEPSLEAAEMSSPAVAVSHEEGESDTFSDPFWQDVDAEVTN